MYKRQAYLEDLAAVCADIQQAESLAEITLTDAESGLVLMSTSPALRVGEANAFLALAPPSTWSCSASLTWAVTSVSPGMGIVLSLIHI